MKKLTSLLVAFFMFLAPLAAPALVHAVATDPDTATTSNNQGETKPETEAEKSARTARLEAYKKKLAEKITDAVKTRVATRCVAAQAIVKTHTTRATTAIKARTAIYDKIVERLEGVVTTVSAAGVDTVALEANIAMLKEKIAAFKTAADTYSQALTDLAAMDCKTDPEAFKAALEAARADLKTAFAAAKDIRTYLNDSVKPTLKALKAAVEANNNSAE